MAVIQLSNGLLFPGVQYVTERVNRQALAGVLTLVSGVSIYLYFSNLSIKKVAEMLLKFRCTETDRQVGGRVGGWEGDTHASMCTHTPQYLCQL